MHLVKVKGHKYTSFSSFQMEIVGVPHPDGSTKWKGVEGIYIHPSDFNPKQKYGAHDEL